MSSESDSDTEYYDGMDDSGSESDGDMTSEYSDTSDEDDDDNVPDNQGWQRITISDDKPPSPPQPAFPFIGDNIIHHVYNSEDEENTYIQYFESFLDDNILDIIVTETNRNAEQKLSGKSETEKKKWHPTYWEEMRIFLSVIMLQGIVKKPEESQYWSKMPLLHTPIFAKIMPYRRFCKIKQYLHLSNNEDFDPATHPCPKLNKIWKFYNSIVSKFNCTRLHKM
ncbi:piggyBac transposable element-derived protein 4-like [Macrobrachium rosenbergii]|uniref:piggyBac transposable element-derived protein 4-like n=1 Tax=Macrobrachium rosenbergii TaxID=79674 RepID=UPI0034D7540A